MYLRPVNLGPQDDHYCAYKAGIDVLATLLQQAVQLDDGDVVELNPAYQPAQSLVREGERRAMIFLAVPQDPCQVVADRIPVSAGTNRIYVNIY